MYIRLMYCFVWLLVFVLDFFLVKEKGCLWGWGEFFNVMWLFVMMFYFCVGLVVEYFFRVSVFIFF